MDCPLHGAVCPVRDELFAREERIAFLRSTGALTGDWPVPEWTPDTCRERAAQKATKPPPALTIQTPDYLGHLKTLYRTQYGEKCEVVQELKNPNARVDWPGYVVLPDGREGPTPESVSDPGAMRRYCRKYGIAEMGAFA